MKHLNEAPYSYGENVEAVNSRRRFLSYFSVAASSLALQACGGGALSVVYTPNSLNAPAPVTPPVSGTQPSTTPPQTTPPPSTVPALSIATIPDLKFVQGVPSSVSLVQWISGADPATVQLTLNTVSLPVGVSYNAAAKSLDYDGVGGPSASSGFVLTAVNS